MTPETNPTTAAQEELRRIVDRMDDLDRRLDSLTFTLPPDHYLLGGIRAVRTDLLVDVIRTLKTLTSLTEDESVQRYFEALDLVDRIAGFRNGGEPMSDPRAIAAHLLRRHGVPDQEVMGALYLDAQLRLIAEIPLFRGGLGHLNVEPRVILRHALDHHAHGFVLWHIHPGGNPTPSDSDRRFTRSMAKLGGLIGVPLHDHLILGPDGTWVSLGREDGSEREEVRS